MRYFFFGVLFLSFSLLFSQDKSAASNLAEAKSLHKKGNTDQAWTSLSQSLKNETKLYNVEAVALALDWYLLENRTKEAFDLLEDVLPTLYKQEKGQIILKRVDYYLKMGNNLAACADLEEAAYLGVSEKEIASRQKVSCKTAEISSLSADNVLSYEIERYKHEQKKYTMQLTLRTVNEDQITDYEWVKTSSQEGGSIFMNEDEQQNGMAEARYLDLDNLVSEGAAQLLVDNDLRVAFTIPKNKFNLLLAGKMPLDIRGIENVFEKTNMQRILVNVGGEDKLLNCIYAKSGENEIWVLDNKRFPLIVRTNLNYSMATLKAIR